jgi:hypothetical protein
MTHLHHKYNYISNAKEKASISFHLPPPGKKCRENGEGVYIYRTRPFIPV